MNIYFYPPRVPLDRDVVHNPYTSNFIEGFGENASVINKDTFSKISILDLFKYIFKMDVVIFNWIENIGHRKYGKFQFLLFLVAFKILEIRKVKIIWIFHNIKPHKGENIISRYVYSLFFDTSDLIVTHSKKAEKYIRKRSSKNILFTHHPNHKIDIEKGESKELSTNNNKQNDFLIWGSIEPYKGILEFLYFNEQHPQSPPVSIQIIGRCSNPSYEKKIQKYINENISFENKNAPFSELKTYIDNSKFVLFPYHSKSISSSGVLLDTLSLNGSCIGPNTGSFSDLAKEDLCYVFDSYKEILDMISTKKAINKDKMQCFVAANSWENFCSKLISEIKKI